MGLSGDSVLPGNYSEAYHLAGVAAPVVRHIPERIPEPVLVASAGTLEAA